MAVAAATVLRAGVVADNIVFVLSPDTMPDGHPHGSQLVLELSSTIFDLCWRPPKGAEGHQGSVRQGSEGTRVQPSSSSCLWAA